MLFMYFYAFQRVRDMKSYHDKNKKFEENTLTRIFIWDKNRKVDIHDLSHFTTTKHLILNCV